MLHIIFLKEQRCETRAVWLAGQAKGMTFQNSAQQTLTNPSCWQADSQMTNQSCSRAAVPAAWLFVLIRKRFRRLPKGSWEFLWNPARLVAGIVIFLSVQSALQLVFQSRAIGPLLAMGGLVFQIASIVIFVNLWQYRPWAWWTVLAITLAGIAVHIWQARKTAVARATRRAPSKQP